MNNYVFDAIKIYSNSGAMQVMEFLGFAAITLVCVLILWGFFSE